MLSAWREVQVGDSIPFRWYLRPVEITQGVNVDRLRRGHGLGEESWRTTKKRRNQQSNWRIAKRTWCPVSQVKKMYQGVGSDDVSCY